MPKESFVKRYGLLIGTGLVVGAAAVLLTALGNPANMGFCIACFLRDIAGALNFQRAGFDAEVGAGIVQYIRPEIIGLVLGSTAIAFARKEFRPKGGSSPMIRFIVAVFVMIGALVFLGCPLRMVIRIGGGDLNAVVGLVGFALGILVGIAFLKQGFSLRRAYQQSLAEGLMLMTPFNASAADSRTTTFVESYKKLSGGVLPNQFAADGYDCMYAIYEACCQIEGVGEMDHSQLCDALIALFTSGTFKVDGLTGTGMTWLESGEISKDPVVVKVENGAYINA